MSRTVQEALEMARWAAHDSYDGVYTVSYMGRSKLDGFTFRVKLHSATGPTYFVEVPDSGRTVIVGSAAQYHDVKVPTGAGGKRRGGKRRGPALTWRSSPNMSELYEAAAPGGGRYVIMMVGAYRTGAKRYDVKLTGTAYDNAWLGQSRSSDGAKRMAGAHANRRAARAQTVAVGPTTRGPWDSGGKRRRAARGSGLIAAAKALRDAWKK